MRCLNCKVPTLYGVACFECTRAGLITAVCAESVRIAFRWFFGVSLVLAVSAGIVAGQSPARVDTPLRDVQLPGGKHLRFWRLHVINGGPTKPAYVGEWVHISANLKRLQPGCRFGQWVPHRDLKVQDRTLADTLLLMPDHHTDIIWTSFCSSR